VTNKQTFALLQQFSPFYHGQIFVSVTLSFNNSLLDINEHIRSVYP